MGTSKSFTARLSLTILLVVSILFIVTLTVVAVSSHKIVLDEAKKSANSILDATISDIEKKIKAVEISTQSGAYLASANLNDNEADRRTIESMVTLNPYIIGSTIAYAKGRHGTDEWYAPYVSIDSTGTLHATNFDNEDYDYYYTDWFQIPFLKKEPCWSEPYYDEGGADQLITTYSYPILDDSGAVVAILTADVLLDEIAEYVSNIHPYENSFAVMISRGGAYINSNKKANLKGETIFSTALQTENDNIMELSTAMVNGERGSKSLLKGRKMSYIVYGPITNGWSIALTCSYSDILARGTRMHVIMIIIGLIGLMIMFVACYKTIKKMTQPVTELSEAALRMAKGELNTPLPELKNEDEMSRLRDSFAHMQSSISDYIQELKTTTASKERMESELNVARNIQLGMLPHNFPARLHAFLEPAKEIGGDLYDFVERGNKLYFAIGDVSGKGVPAALMMAITRASMRFFSGLGFSMSQVINRVNRSVTEANKNDLFVTLFAGRLNIETGLMEYCNAGHNPIVIVPPDEPAYFLRAKANLAIGLFNTFEYEDEQITLKPGTRVILYTDGVTEAERADKQQYGDDRLLSWAESHARYKQTESKEDQEQIHVMQLYNDVKKFTGGIEANDDITIMSILF